MSVRSVSVRVRSVVTLSLPLSVSSPERSAGLCRCSAQLVVGILGEAAELGSQVPCILETDQVHPPPLPIRIQVSAQKNRRLDL